MDDRKQTLVALSNTGRWKLKFDEQDVRGFDALNGEANRVGIVEDMLIDPDARRVEVIVLDDGTEYPARDISIGDGVVYLTTAEPVGEVARPYQEEGHLVERAHYGQPDVQAHTGAFREHCATTYGASGENYETYDPAYCFGYETAYEKDYRERTYAQAEADLEQRYRTRYPDSDYSGVRDAVQYGYRRARQGY